MEKAATNSTLAASLIGFRACLETMRCRPAISTVSFGGGAMSARDVDVDCVTENALLQRRRDRLAYGLCRIASMLFSDGHADIERASQSRLTHWPDVRFKTRQVFGIWFPGCKA